MPVVTIILHSAILLKTDIGVFLFDKKATILFY